MKFLISIFSSFFIYDFSYSLIHKETLLFEELKNERIHINDSFHYPGFSDFITKAGKVSITKKKMSKNKFREWIQQDKTIFFSQFEPDASPYAGPISNQIECINNFKPKPLFTDKKKRGLIMEGFIYKSNSRFVALNCQNAGDSTYDSVYIAIYCSHFGYKIKIHKRNTHTQKQNKKNLIKVVNGFFCLPHKT